MSEWLNNLPISWEVRRLDEVAEVIDSLHKTPSYAKKGYPMVRVADIRDGLLDLSNALYVTNTIYEEFSRRKKPEKGDIVFSRVGTYGNASYVSTDKRFCLGQNTALIHPKKALDRFLHYFLLSPIAKYQIESSVVGSTQKTISLKNISALHLPFPPLPEQKSIASILSSLDDKIELNRRMNDTLEAMARAIFKDWFIDFAPTRTKQAGLPPYLPEHIWSLFPEALDVETGLPIGWEEVTLNHHIQFNPSESLKKGTEAPYLGMNALPTQGSISDPPVLRAFTSGMRFRNGDTLFARITPCLENGKTAFVQNLASNDIGWGSTEFIVMRSIPPVPKVFTYLIARDQSFRTIAIQSMTGTSGRQRARTEALENYVFCKPQTKVWELLASSLNPIFDKIACHGLESRTLAEMRDKLLPKLMSGEIRVKDAEQMVEEVA